jgi:hypothetical protein
MTETCFKACAETYHGFVDEYISSFMYRTGLEMKYRIGMKTQTKDGTPLFAFGTFKHADSYRYAHSFKLFECEYEPYTEHNPVRVIIPDLVDLNWFSPKTFWSDPNKFTLEHPIATTLVPFGTIFCKWIKPIRLIE